MELLPHVLLAYMFLSVDVMQCLQHSQCQDAVISDSVMLKRFISLQIM